MAVTSSVVQVNGLASFVHIPETVVEVPEQSVIIRAAHKDPRESAPVLGFLALQAQDVVQTSVYLQAP